MKFSIAALALLGLVAANPVPNDRVIISRAVPNVPGLSIGPDGKAHLPPPTPGDCNSSDAACCTSGKTFCRPGWSCSQADGTDVCMPPGLVNEGGKVHTTSDGNGPQIANNLPSCELSVGCKGWWDCYINFGCEL